MKKIKKLQINPEKLINNNELMTLKGGYDGDEPCTCTCYNYFISPPIWYGYLLSETGDCPEDCRYAFGGLLTSGYCND